MLCGRKSVWELRREENEYKFRLFIFFQSVYRFFFKVVVVVVVFVVFAFSLFIKSISVGQIFRWLHTCRFVDVFRSVAKFNFNYFWVSAYPHSFLVWICIIYSFTWGDRKKGSSKNLLIIILRIISHIRLHMSIRHKIAINPDCVYEICLFVLFHFSIHTKRQPPKKFGFFFVIGLVFHVEQRKNGEQFSWRWHWCWHTRNLTKWQICNYKNLPLASALQLFRKYTTNKRV